MKERERFLGRVSERMAWLARRFEAGGQPVAGPEQHELGAIREHLGDLRARARARVREDLSRVRDDVHDMSSELRGTPAPHLVPTHAEREAVRHHITATERLIAAESADPAEYEAARDAYDRTWEEVVAAVEGEAPGAHA